MIFAQTILIIMESSTKYVFKKFDVFYPYFVELFHVVVMCCNNHNLLIQSSDAGFFENRKHLTKHNKSCILTLINLY